MKRKTAGLYNPYLDTLGGGEKHILSILKVLDDEGYDINIFWDKDLKKEIKERFNLKFKRIRFLPNIFKKGKLLTKLTTLINTDLLFYIPDGSYFFSTAKKNYIFSMVPNKSLYPINLVNKLKTWNYRFIANSWFTHYWLKSWNINSEVIYPFLDDQLIDLDIKNVKKDKIILSIGRFFKQLHSKRQDIIINLFKTIIQSNALLKDFKLILAGGLKEEDKLYYETLKKTINDDDSIILKPNISHKELMELYKKSMIYWHLTGFEINEKNHPEMVEHLGIAPLEAMASGCLVFCYNAGGPKEIIKDGQTGFLFNDEEELVNKTKIIAANELAQKQIKDKAKKFVKKNFTYKIFKNRVKKVILNKV